MELLEGILKLKRPANGCTEREAINKFIIPTGAVADRFGNYHLKIGDTPIIWSSHTDTVHMKSGTQKITYGEKDGCIYLDETVKKADCLGADDGAGMWLMIKMIEAGVSGHYVLHREEEIGGNGSSFITQDADWQAEFKEYKAVIALDRRGYNNVITHQGSRCCSDKFAQELSDQLNTLMYRDGLDLNDPATVKYYQWKGARGVWTDSANYTDIVGACTNLSVGYFNQHSYLECLDPKFLEELLQALIHLDTDALLESCTRQPGDVEVVPRYYGHGNWSKKSPKVPTHGGNILLDDDPLYDDATNTYLNDIYGDKGGGEGYGYDSMSDIVEEYSDEVAMILKASGYSEFDLLDEIDKISGAINV